MIYIIIGFFSGIIGGMGMGGGTILIPTLIMLMNIDPKIAQSINLISSIPMAIFALKVHLKNKHVILDIVVPIAIFGVLGSIIGTFVAGYLPSDILSKIFAVFLFVVGCYEIHIGIKNKRKNINNY